MDKPKLIYYFSILLAKVVIYSASQTSSPNGRVYAEVRKNVIGSTILEEIEGVSKINCALRCRRLKECIRPATEERQTGTVCLLLKDPDDAGKYVSFPMRVFDKFQPQGMHIFSF